MSTLSRNQSRQHNAGFRKTAFNWQQFDALPRAYKEIVWNASFHAAVNPEKTSVIFAKRAAELGTSRMALSAYGPEHPQAALAVAERNRQRTGIPVNSPADLGL